MNKTMFSGKIHRATVTDANLNYVGSITIDSTLISAANMLPNEKVHVVNINNGARFETYIIEGDANSGVICINGAASRLVQPQDKVIIIAYMSMPLEVATNFVPTVVQVDDANRITNQKELDLQLELCKKVINY